MKHKQAKIESEQKQEAKEMPPVQESPEAIRQEILEQSEKEVADFKGDGSQRLESLEERANSEQLHIDEQDKIKLGELNQEADLARQILLKELETLEFKKERIKKIADDLDEGIAKQKRSLGYKVKKVFSGGQLAAEETAEIARRKVQEMEQQIQDKKQSAGLQEDHETVQSNKEKTLDTTFLKIENHINAITDKNKPEEVYSQQEIEVENELMGEYTLKLLEIVKQAPADSIERQRAEKMIIKLFSSADYVNADEYNKNPKSRSFSGIYSKSMNHIYRTLSEQTLLRSGIKMKKQGDYIPKNKKPELFYQMVESGIRKERNEVEKNEAETANHLFVKILETYNLPAEEFIGAWKKSSYNPEKLSTDLMALDSLTNLERIRSLEQMRPGITSTLNNEFGIKFFGRYGEKTLVRQYDEKDDVDKPYGIMLSALDDHNGSFMHVDQEIQGFVSRLDDKYNLRIAEVDGKIDIKERLTTFNERYGAEQKISFLAVNGHGQRDSVTFGKDIWWKRLLRIKQDGLFESRDLDWVKGMKNIFSKSPWFIFNSCHTGENEGIAQKTAATFESGSLGPNAETFGVLNFAVPVFKGNKIDGFVSNFSDHVVTYEHGNRVREENLQDERQETILENNEDIPAKHLSSSEDSIIIEKPLETPYDEKATEVSEPREVSSDGQMEQTEKVKDIMEVEEGAKHQELKQYDIKELDKETIEKRVRMANWVTKQLETGGINNGDDLVRKAEEGLTESGVQLMTTMFEGRDLNYINSFLQESLENKRKLEESELSQYRESLVTSNEDRVEKMVRISRWIQKQIENGGIHDGYDLVQRAKTTLNESGVELTKSLFEGKDMDHISAFIEQSSENKRKLDEAAKKFENAA